MINTQHIQCHQKEHEIKDQLMKYTELNIILNYQLRYQIKNLKNNMFDKIFLKPCSLHRFLLPNDCHVCQKIINYKQPRKPCEYT